MGIKRCPSFSKRPGFPCGLRVLLLDVDAAQRSESAELLKECSYEVTACSSACEALSRLSGSCSYDVLLVDKSTLSSSSESQQQLLDKAKGLPCILMACNPSQDDVLKGVELGAVDFLAKPLSPLKLKNIWQHTVRKMMCNMNINCMEVPASAAAMMVGGKARVSMEVIMEEAEEETAAAAAAAGIAGPGAPASTTNAPNMALAITSSFYEPSRVSLSRSGSSAITTPSSASGAATETFGTSPDSPIESRPTKQQHCKHGPVRSCPSTRSLTSMNSTQSSWQLPLPHSPSSPNLQKESGDAAAEADTVSEDAAGCKSAQRLMKKAVRHAGPAAVGTPVLSTGKPPLAGKPAAQSQQAVAGMSAQHQQQGHAAAAAAPSNSAGAASQGQMVSGLSSIPLPVGLGPLPQGMVWGMPMCPLARAPGIVPPASSTAGMAVGTACAAQPGPVASMPMGPWGMYSMPPTMFGSVPPPFIQPGYGSMQMPSMGMAMPYAGAAAAAAPGAYGCPSGMMAPGMPPAGCYMDPSMQQMGGYYPQQQEAEQQQWNTAMLPGPRTRSRAAAAAAPTGAAAAAALDASIVADMFADGNAGAVGVAAAAAGADVAEDDAFDFVLGDIAAEDDLTDVCGSLLDGDLSALDDDALKSFPAELEALEADMQKQQIQQVAAAAAANRGSFECSNAPRQRISFDCSTASTCTAARTSFDASRTHSARASFEVSTRNSNRVSFEVSCCGTGGKGAAAANSMGLPAPGTAPAPANMGSAASAPADLLGSMSDLWAACSGDSCEGSGGLPHVDSCGVLTDLQDLFDATGDSCGRRDGADSALTGSGGGLFADTLEDIPLELALKKSSSLAELINGGLTGLAN